MILWLHTPAGYLLQHFWIFFLIFKVSWQTPHMEARLRRAKLDCKSLEDPGITSWTISHTLHTLGVFLQLLSLLPGTGRPGTPASVWGESPSDLGDPIHVGHPSGFLGNLFSCVQPDMLWSILHAVWQNPVSVTADFLLFVLSGLTQTRIPHLLHQMHCNPLPPDTDWEKNLAPGAHCT